MRSSEALMRSALTTMRRSRATGCWRARIVIASSSSATVRLVDAGVLGDDLLGEAHVRLVERARRLVDRDRDEFGDLDESVLHLAQFLLEHLTHVEILVCSVPRAERTQAHRSDPAPDILPGAGERQVP